MSYSYRLELTGDELRALDFMADRGYFPRETRDAMELVSEVGNITTGESLVVYTIPEHAAWAISAQREEDSHSLFACAAPALLRKLLALEESIV